MQQLHYFENFTILYEETLLAPFLTSLQLGQGGSNPPVRAYPGLCSQLLPYDWTLHYYRNLADTDKLLSSLKLMIFYYNKLLQLHSYYNAYMNTSFSPNEEIL